MSVQTLLGTIFGVAVLSMFALPMGAQTTEQAAREQVLTNPFDHSFI